MGTTGFAGITIRYSEIRSKLIGYWEIRFLASYTAFTKVCWRGVEKAQMAYLW